jgi:ketosteroid isomerase-like protein
MNDGERRLLVERHHDASRRGDMDAVHAICHDDAVIV